MARKIRVFDRASTPFLGQDGSGGRRRGSLRLRAGFVAALTCGGLAIAMDGAERFLVPLDAGASLEWKRQAGHTGVLRVKKVVRDSESARLGYAKGDEIISIGGETIGARRLPEFLALSGPATSFGIRRKTGELELPPLFHAAGIIEGTDHHEIKPGQPLPRIAALTRKGSKLDPEMLAGKVVLINFWATWCPPCMAELPRFVELYRENKERGLVVVSINVDDDPAVAETVLKTTDRSFVLLHDHGLGGITSRTFRVTTLPMTLLVDRTGTIRQVSLGYSKEAFERHVARPVKLLLDGTAPLVNIVSSP